MLIIKPSERLSPFIRYYWILEGDFRNHRELVYPTGEIQLLFHYETPFFNQEENGQWSKQPRANFAGQNTDHKVVCAAGSCGVIAAVFFPCGAFPFVKTSLHQLNNLSVPLSEVIPSFDHIEERICESSSLRERIDIIEDELVKSLDSKKLNHIAMLQRGIHLMETHSEEFSLKKIKEESSYSMKQYERIFKEYTGLTPMMFLQILRLGRAVSLLKTASTDLTTIAYDSGFYDQSHFIRKFKSFTGLTPGEFRKFLK